MPVDRQLRDKLADATVSWMRGESGASVYDDVVLEIEGADIEGKTNDDGVIDAASHLWFFYDDFIDHPVSVSREGWEHLRRWIALLRTDYRLKEQARRIWHRDQILAFVGVAVLVASLLFSYYLHQWWILATAWLATGLVRPWMKLPRSPDDAHLQKLRFAPFLSAEDWAAHEHLLDNSRLPDYDPEKHKQPIRGWLGRWRMKLNEVALQILFVPITAILSVLPEKFSVLLREDTAKAVEAGSALSKPKE